MPQIAPCQGPWVKGGGFDHYLGNAWIEAATFSVEARIRSIHVLSICTTKCIGSHLPDTITRVEAMDILHRDSQKLALLKENILLLPNRGPSRLRLSEFFQILHYWNFYFLLNFNHWSRLQLDKYTWLYHKQTYVVITRFCRDTGYVALTCFCRESCHDIT